MSSRRDNSTKPPKSAIRLISKARSPRNRQNRELRGRLAKLDNFSRLMRLTQLSAPEVVRPRTEGSFGILRDAEDMATLVELRGSGDLSKEARRKLEDFLEQQTKKALTRLKLWLGLKRGRPRDFSKRARWNLGAQLREKDRKRNSWRTITRKLDKDGFDDDPHGATDRMRHGIEAVLKDRRGKGKSA